MKRLLETVLHVAGFLFVMAILFFLLGCAAGLVIAGASLTIKLL